MNQVNKSYDDESTAGRPWKNRCVSNAQFNCRLHYANVTLETAVDERTETETVDRKCKLQKQNYHTEDASGRDFSKRKVEQRSHLTLAVCRQD